LFDLDANKREEIYILNKISDLTLLQCLQEKPWHSIEEKRMRVRKEQVLHLRLDLRANMMLITDSTLSPPPGIPFFISWSCSTSLHIINTKSPINIMSCYL